MKMQDSRLANQDDPLRLLGTSDKEGGKVTFRLRQKFGIDEPKTAEEIQIEISFLISLFLSNFCSTFMEDCFPLPLEEKMFRA